MSFIIDLVIAASSANLDRRALVDQAIITAAIEQRIPHQMIVPSWGVVKNHVLSTLHGPQFLSTWNATACAKARACRITEDVIAKDLESYMATKNTTYFTLPEWSMIRQEIIDNTVGYARDPICPLANRRTGGPAGWAHSLVAEINVLLGHAHPRTHELAAACGEATSPTVEQLAFLDRVQKEQRAFINRQSYRAYEANRFADMCRNWKPTIGDGVKLIGGIPVRMKSAATPSVKCAVKIPGRKGFRDIVVKDTTARGYSHPSVPREWHEARVTQLSQLHAAKQLTTREEWDDSLQAT